MGKLEEGWATVLLLVALAGVAGLGAEAPGWVPGLWVASAAGALGVLAGLALSKSRFSGPVAALFAACYGLFAVGFFIGQTLEGNWYRRSWELIIRINNFLYYALHGGTSRDFLPFPVSVGLIFWAIGVSAAWAVFRRGAVWPAIIPGGVVLLINAYYYVGDKLDVFVAAYLVLALLLLTRVNLLAREREWRAARVNFTPDTRFEFLRAGLMAALLIVAVAWTGQQATTASASPQAVAAWNRVNGAWSSVRENFERLFNAVRNPGVSATDFYGDSLILSGPTRLSEQVIMTVAVGPVDEEGIESVEEAALPPIPRLYWRATAYQEYVSGRWQTGNALEFREQDPSRPAERLPAYRLRRDVSASFVSYLSAPSRLYVLPQPKFVDRPTTFETYIAPGGTLDPISVRAQTVLTGDDKRYRVIASVSVADVESLRLAGTDYPSWVVENFVQLPDTITPRTRELAKQIVAGAEATNPYDQAQAITDWLRQNITYDQAVPAPPDGLEPIDWFLFDLQRGYCNYYASAMVVMLRSLGIPARMAVGFNQGEFDAEIGLYTVRERNAHAWPEVFFPNYGWIEFEPTASEAPLVRPVRSTVADPEPNPAADAAQPQRPERDELDEDAGAQNTPAGVDWGALLARWGANLGLGALVVGLLGLGGLTFLLRANLLGMDSLGRPGERLLRWMGRAVPSAVTQAYLELERAARWLGLNLPESLTPRERAAELNATLPQAKPAVDTITAQYMAEQYGPDPELPNGRLAQSAWRAIRFGVWREGITRFFRSWTEDDFRKAARRRPPDTPQR